MALEKKETTIERDGRVWVLRRPGRGGLARLARRLAVAADNGMGLVSSALMDLDGRGLEMEAILHEYLVQGPDDWRVIDPQTKKPSVRDDGRPLWSFEEADADEFAAVGEGALAFHATFRNVDARFGAGGGRPA